MSDYSEDQKRYQVNKNFEHHRVMGTWFWTCRNCGRSQRMGNAQELPRATECAHCKDQSPPAAIDATQPKMF